MYLLYLCVCYRLPHCTVKCSNLFDIFEMEYFENALTFEVKHQVCALLMLRLCLLKMLKASKIKFKLRVVLYVV